MGSPTIAKPFKHRACPAQREGISVPSVSIALLIAGVFILAGDFFLGGVCFLAERRPTPLSRSRASLIGLPVTILTWAVA